MIRRIVGIIAIIIVGTIAAFAYPPAFRSLQRLVRNSPAPSPQVTFLDIPANTGSTELRLGVLPKEFPRELLPPAFSALAARRVVFTGGETQTIVSFENTLPIETLRAWYAQQFAAQGWDVQSEQTSAGQISMRAVKSLRYALTVTLQELDATRRKAILVYAVRPF